MIDYTAFYWVEMLLKEGKTFLIVGTCLIVFFNLKQQICILISRMNAVKFGDYEVNFKKITHEIKVGSVSFLNDIPLTNDFLSKAILSNFEDFEQTALTQPNVAVLSAWRELELTALTLASKKGANINGASLGRASGVAALKNTSSNRVIPYDVINLYEKAGESIKPISKGKLYCAPEDALIFCQNAKRLSNYLTSFM